MNEPKHIIKICTAGSCRRNFCADTIKAAEKELGTAIDSVTLDGKTSLQQCGCLGNCSQGPSAMINDKLHGEMLPKKMKEKIRELHSKQH